MNAAGNQTSLNRALGVANQLQGLQAGQRSMELQEQQLADQREADLAQSQARAKGAELLANGTPDQIASFGIKNPEVMKDFISMAKFKDESAVGTRVKYAQDIISGSVSPRVAILKRIAEVESSGGDASGLKQTAALSNEDIISAAEKDLAVISPKTYMSYKDAISKDGSRSKTNFAPTVSALQTDPKTGQQYTVITDRNSGESVRKNVDGAIAQSLEQEQDSEFRGKSLNDSRELSKEMFGELRGVKSQIGTINEAIKAIDDGASSGAFDKYLPSFRESTIALENAAQRMGLDVIAATTFGALSEGELRLAMDTAVPKNLNPKQLRKWLGERKIAKTKLANELSKMAIELGKGKTTVAEYLAKNASFTPREDGITGETKTNNQDEQALQWAKSNPNDPRSAQILQKLGVKS